MNNLAAASNKRNSIQEALYTPLDTTCAGITQIGTCFSSAIERIVRVAAGLINSLSRLVQKAACCLSRKKETNGDDVDAIPHRITQERETEYDTFLFKEKKPLPKQRLQQIILITEKDAATDDSSSDGEEEAPGADRPKWLPNVRKIKMLDELPKPAERSLFSCIGELSGVLKIFHANSVRPERI
jgi:hypothetical protein